MEPLSWQDVVIGKAIFPTAAVKASVFEFLAKLVQLTVPGLTMVNQWVQIVGCRGEIEINPRLLMGPETQIRGVGLTAFWDLKAAFNNCYEIQIKPFFSENLRGTKISKIDGI